MSILTKLFCYWQECYPSVSGREKESCALSKFNPYKTAAGKLRRELQNQSHGNGFLAL